MVQRTFKLVRAADGRVIAERVALAAGFAGRARGLAGREELPVGEGIWLAPCNGVHTFGMRFPVDVLVMDRDLCAVAIRHAVKPMRAVLPVRGGHSTVELRAGTLNEAGVQMGDRLDMQAVST